MTDQASENATARIERALARIEAVTQGVAASDTDLLRRHESLREQVGAALVSLDSLIAKEDEG